MSCPFGAAGAEMPVDHPAVPKDGQPKAQQEIPIPQPPPSRFLGNFLDMDPSFPSRPFQRLGYLYGEIYQLDLNQRTVVVSSQKLVNEVCDQDRFHKDIHRTVGEVRALTGDGLFTAAHEDGQKLKREENWWKAHRLLVPAFGPLGLRKMVDDMQDISAQMMLRWDRLGEENVIDCSDDFTRLAFDTIGLCSFGYRFNEFYSDDAHPFAKQMANVLRISGSRANRADLLNSLYRSEERERQSDVKKMNDLALEIVAERKAHPKPDAKDLLNTMLYAVDRETGETLTDQNIVNNMVTFLVAGHETTSSTLSFMWYHLLKQPETFHRAQKEIDEVVGDAIVSGDMLPKLEYIDACIKETLRLNFPIAVLGVIPKEETLIGEGKYRIKKDDLCLVNLEGLHHDPAVWGDDHNEFKPERFLDGKFQALPPNSWKPFGNGLRACIGRGFSEQEMLLNTAMILQRFIPEMADPSYDLKIRSTLTVKPDKFYMRVRRRPGRTLFTGIPGGVPSEIAQKQSLTEKAHAKSGAAPSGKKVKVFYGGNSGTCEGFAQSFEEKLSERGVQADISSLDSATENLSKDDVNVIITASYEGKPPDNAKQFVAWLEHLDDKAALQGVKFSVMGVGNSDWASTFHRIPKLVDERMQQLGAEVFTPAGFANVKTDLLGPFDDWSESLVNAISGAAAEPQKSALKISVQRSNLAKELGDEKMGVGVVLKNNQLADTSVGLEKKHIEVRLPEGMSYESGDYLVIHPRNPAEAVRKVMRYFSFDERMMFSVEGSKKKFLPTSPTPIEVFLHDHVELGTPVTKRQLKTLAGYAKDQDQKTLEDDAAQTAFQEKRYTIIDVLLDHTIDLPFEAYIDMLVPLTPRQYSISSSPLAENHLDTVSLTYDVHSSPALSGHGIFEGSCSSFLASRKTGDRISCCVRSTNVGFRLPSDDATPIIMFAAGTGIAPMRAFLQERAAIAATNTSRKLGPALLFYGSRDAEKDFMYKDELDAWQKQGVVTVYGAHSRMPNAGSEGHPKYVQDAIWEHRKEVADLFYEGGKIYLCGSAAKLGQSSAEVCKKIWLEYHEDKSDKDAEEWLQSVKSDRYVADVY